MRCEYTTMKYTPPFDIVIPRELYSDLIFMLQNNYYLFATAERCGRGADEPEGSKVVTLSHTLATQLAVEFNVLGDRLLEAAQLTSAKVSP